MAETSQSHHNAAQEPGIRAWPAIVYGFLAALVGGGLIELGKLEGLSSGGVLRDVAATYDLPVTAGAATMMGVTLLGMTTAVTSFAAWLLPARRGIPIAVAIFSFILMIDDHFLIHEEVGPRIGNIPELAFMAAFALGGFLITLATARELGLRGTVGLAPAIFFLASSIVADLELLGDSSYATEDLTKLAGYAAWLAFWSAYSARRLRPGQ